MSESYNLFYFFKQFPDEISCWKFLEKRRWGNTPTCPHCGNAQKIYRYKNGKTFKCAYCKKQFSVKTGLIDWNPISRTHTLEQMLEEIGEPVYRWKRKEVVE